jgi:hypothetical protein
MLPAPLPDLDGLDPEMLKALLIAKHNESLEQHKQLRSNSEEIGHLKLIIEKYRRMIFGRKSEKLTRELEQLELRPLLKRNSRFPRSPSRSPEHRVQDGSLFPKTCLAK